MVIIYFILLYWFCLREHLHSFKAICINISEELKPLRLLVEKTHAGAHTQHKCPFTICDKKRKQAASDLVVCGGTICTIFPLLWIFNRCPVAAPVLGVLQTEEKLCDAPLHLPWSVACCYGNSRQWNGLSLEKNKSSESQPPFSLPLLPSSGQ